MKFPKITEVAQKIGFVPARKFAKLEQSFYEMQVALANLQETASTATGNPYKEYKTAIKELVKKYDGEADWGNYQARSIIDVRAAFTIGNGIQAIERDQKTGKSKPDQSGTFQKEMDFINAFIQHNDLDEEGAQEFAKEAELEGRILFKLIPNKDKKQIDLRFLSFDDLGYEVQNKEGDYKVYESVSYKTSTEEVELEMGKFVYKRFAGRANKVNEFRPKVATILRVIEDLDKALKDLRKINNLFASPTPHFDCEDETSARSLYKTLKDINWNVGKFLTTAKVTFNMVGTDTSGVDSIEKEITNCVKIISGTTGIPVHFLGLPDLMSNRSTSTDLFELIIASTNRERKTWIGCYEEVFMRAMEMSNSEFKTNFNVNAVSCDIPQITAAKLKELVEVWLPLFTANVIDLDYFLSMIPDADPEAIKESNRKAAEEMVRMMQQSEQNQDDNQDDDQGGQ